MSNTNELQRALALIGEDDVDVASILSRKAIQLESMLIAIFGDGLQPFMDLNDSCKDGYLWACADLAHQICALSRQVPYKNLTECAISPIEKV